MNSGILSTHMAWKSKMLAHISPEGNWHKTPVGFATKDGNGTALLKHPPSAELGQPYLPQDSGEETQHKATLNVNGQPANVYLKPSGRDHEIVGGDSPHLNGYKLSGIPPYVPEEEDEDGLLSRLRGVQPEVDTLKQEEVEHSPESLDEIASLAKSGDAEGANRRMHQDKLQRLQEFASQIPSNDGLVVVSNRRHLPDLNNALSGRGDTGYWDDLGNPHGNVEHTVVAPSASDAVMEKPSHVVYYDQDPPEGEDTSRYITARRLRSPLED